ncbi:MAG: GNAT family N-acetyltransferase [Caulobacteraceae bacterium]|nr:GNAT family N-acetyltransferase [Caulobacter sp.]
MTAPHRPTPLQARVTRPDAVAPADLEAWRGMIAATPQFASPLLGPEFAQLAGRVRDDVRVAVFARDGETVGVLAHHRRPDRLARPVGAPWSDVHALLTWPGRPTPWREALAAADLRAFRFSQLVDPHGVFADARREPAAAHLLASDPAGGETAWERLRAASPKRFKNIRRLEHKLEREVGPLVLEVERSRDAFEQLVAWKRDQYGRTGALDVLHPAWSRALLEAAFALETPALSGRVITLRAGGRLVAAHFGVQGGAVFHPWLAGLDPELRAYSPGVVFLSRLVRSPLGFDRYELGAGCDAYKTVFSDQSETVASGIVDVRAAPRRTRAPALLLERVRSRLDHIAEVDLTFTDRVHGMARSMLDAPRRMRAAPGQGAV